METFDDINTFKDEDPQLFESLLDDVRVPVVRFETCRPTVVVANADRRRNLPLWSKRSFAYGSLRFG